MSVFRLDLLSTRAWGLALATGAALAAGNGVRAVYRFEVTRLRRKLPGLRRPLRVALLTDLHLGPFLGIGMLRAWLAATAAAEPDLVLYGGDLVDRSFRGDLAAVAATVARLAPPLGAFWVPGNHDRTRYPDLEPLTSACSRAGVVRLLDEGLWLRDDLYLAGIDDLRTGTPDPERALAGGAAPGARLLLSHNPDVLPLLQRRSDLVLCGHTHGGQVCPPGIGPILTSSRHGRRFAAGWIEEPRLAFVSRGLGVTTLPLRWGCRPELAIFDLQPADTGR